MSPVHEAPTPLADAVARIGDRWTLLVIEALLDGPRRFGELADDVDGIAPNILTRRLRHLEEEGLVVARPYSERPRRLAYALTASGRELGGAISLLAQWAAPDADHPVSPQHTACGTPLEARWYCPTCERAVDGAEASELPFV
jgi:DNA-binding HxlR family transcriptional regulator